MRGVSTCTPARPIDGWEKHPMNETFDFVVVGSGGGYGGFYCFALKP